MSRIDARLAVSAVALVLATAAAPSCSDGRPETVHGFPVADVSASAPAQPRQRCSMRYGDPVMLGPVPEDAGRSVEAALNGFEVDKAWGVDGNLVIRRSAERYPAVFEVLYPKGSYTPSAEDAPRGGAGFYARADLGDGRRACLHYAVRFPDGFAFVKGGKLPGLFGGEAPSGGEEVTGRNGFSVRLMWRRQGDGEAYAYVVNKTDDSGLSVGRGNWRFAPSQWTEIDMEIVLNDPDRANGVLRVWVDGTQTIEQTDLVYRTVDDIRIDGLMFSTFFGGNDESWASPKDQKVQFADFRLFAAESAPR